MEKRKSNINKQYQEFTDHFYGNEKTDSENENDFFKTTRFEKSEQKR